METGEFRYFRAYGNESLFERPVYVWRRRDLNRLRLRLQRFDITNYILRQRPDTKWKPYLVTNVRFVLYHLNYPLGSAEQLPDYIISCKSIVDLVKSRIGKQLYKYHLCAFLCLAVHRGHLTDTLETHVKDLHDKWKDLREVNTWTSIPRNSRVYHSIKWSISSDVSTSTSTFITYGTTTWLWPCTNPDVITTTSCTSISLIITCPTFQTCRLTHKSTSAEPAKDIFVEWTTWNVTNSNVPVRPSTI
jgi:hypothetical protein